VGVSRAANPSLRIGGKTTWGLSRFSRSENGTVPLRNAEVILRPLLTSLRRFAPPPDHRTRCARASPQAIRASHAGNRDGEAPWAAAAGGRSANQTHVALFGQSCDQSPPIAASRPFPHRKPATIRLVLESWPSARDPSRKSILSCCELVEWSLPARMNSREPTGTLHRGTRWSSS